MGIQSNVDLATLSWCIDEIRESLNQAEAALETLLASSGSDESALKLARLQIHQAHGALLVVDIPGATVLTEEVETVLDEIGKKNVNLDVMALASLRAAFGACVEYLEDLLQGRPDQPLYLFPYLQALLRLRGAEREHPADLFFPDLTRRLPDSLALPVLSVGSFDPSEQHDLADARKAFEKGLLKFLREPGKPRGAEYMLAAVGMVERKESHAASRNFWRVTMVFLEALRTGVLAADVYTKRLLARLNLQLRKAVDGGQQVADRLVTDTLFALASAGEGSALVDQARRAYELTGMVPADYATPRYGRHDVRSVRAARDALTQTRMAWDSLSHGNAADAGGLGQALVAFQAAVARLPGDGMKQLAAVLCAVGQQLARNRELFDAPVALEAATAILFADQILEQGGRAGDELDPRAQELAQRLRLSLDGSDPGPIPAWLQTLSAAAQERMTMASFISETLASLRNAETELDAFFRDPAKRAALPDAARQLSQVGGALELLGHQDAAKGAHAAAVKVSAFADSPEPPAVADCERVAASCGALGFYVEGLQQSRHHAGQFEFDEATGEFRARLGDAALPAEAPEDESQSMARHKQQAEELLASLQQAPSDAAVRQQLRGALEQVRDDALLRDDGDLKKQAAAAIDLLSSGSQEGIDKLSEALARMAPPVPAEQPAAADIPTDAAAIDQELLEIFLSEAQEVLVAIEEAAAESRRAPSDQQFLTTIRRGFHTLKGSSRMVGLNAFGEAGWAMEQVLNLWLAEDRSGTADLYALIDAERTSMSVWVEKLEASAGTVRIDPTPLIIAADRFRETRVFEPFAPLEADDAIEIAAPVAADEAVEIAAPVAADEAIEIAPPVAVDETIDVAAPAAIDEAIEIAAPVTADDAFAPVPVTLAGQSDGVGAEVSLEAAVSAEASTAAKAAMQAPETIELDVLGPVQSPDMAADLAGFNEQMDLAIAGFLAEPAIDHPDGRHASIEALSQAEPPDAEVIAQASADPVDELPQPAADTGHVDQPAAVEAQAAEVPAAEEPAVAAPAVETSAVDSSAVELPAAEASAIEASAAEASADVIVIGGQQVSRPLYTIFLGEADELVTRLARDCEEWRAQPDREASEDAERAAHSLAGSAALVGMDVMHQLGERLEQIYQAQRSGGHLLASADFDVLATAIEQGRGLLTEFAAGRVPELDPDTLDGLALLHLRLLATPPRSIGALRSSDAPAVADGASAAESAPVAEAGVDAGQSVPQAGHLLANVAAPAPAVAAPAVAAPAAAAPAAVAAPVPVAAPSAHAAVLPEEPGTPATVDELDAELLPIFIEEAEDLLPIAGNDLRRWAEAPADAGLARNLMRAMHTIKGSARMAGAMTLGQLVHEMETRIEALTALPAVPRHLIDELIADHDQVMALFEGIKDPAKAVSPLPRNDVSSAAAPVQVSGASADARPAAAGVPANAGQPATAGAAVAPAGAASRPAGGEPARVAQQAAQKAATQLVRVRADLLDLVVNEAGEASIARSKLDNELTGMRQSLSDLTENVNRLRTQLREIEIQAESQIQAHFAQTKESDRAFDPLEFDRYTRFQELTRMMAESVNDVATVQQNAARNLDEAAQELARQGQVLRDLQQNLMRVRMVQFGTIADRLFRVARQAAKETGKRVNLDLRGSTVEVDRGVLEKMAGPLEHLVRNAVGHGIESRDARQAAGKPETGEIRVEVRQEGNEIILIMADDGGGLNLAKIRARAESIGLVAPEAQPTDRELREMIFAPGFSTADRITELSGRGVGMDVVRVETSSLGGRIETDSEFGKGTRFTIHLPLTLAVAQVVLMGAAGSRFAVPSSSVEQVLQMKPQALASGYSDGHVEWQGQKVPLFYLGALVELQDRSPVAQHHSPVAILRSGNQRIALHVDTLARNQEVVVKNVGPQVSRVPGVSGATVLGNGDIVLIINPVQLAIEAVGPALDALSAAAPMIQRIALEMPATVMVVDDSVTVRKVTQRLLAREGYQVLLAKDGVDALRQIQDTVPDVMLVDIEMPRMDGFDLTRAIRADQRYAKIPIVMITSRTADKHRNLAFELGVNAYLGKPYSEEELLGQIEGFLREAKMGRLPRQQAVSADAPV